MQLNRALGKVTVISQGVARDFSQVHCSNSTLTLLLNGIPCGLLWKWMLLFSHVLITFWSFRQFFTGELHAAYWLKGRYAPASENTTLRNKQNTSLSIDDYCHYQCRPRLGVVTLPILPTGKQLVFVTDFPKLPWENFHGYAKKNKRISHDN